MICREVQELIHGYIDGELDLVRSLEMDRHFHDCAACAGIQERLRTMRSAMSGSLPYFQPPAGMEARLRGRLRAAGRPERRAPRFAMRWQWVGVAAALLLTVAGTWRAALMHQRPGATELVAQEVVSSHVRSLMA